MNKTLTAIMVIIFAVLARYHAAAFPIVAVFNFACLAAFGLVIRYMVILPVTRERKYVRGVYRP